MTNNTINIFGQLLSLGPDQQTYEQIFDPIRVPICIGNEIYILTQQDVRNIIDTRYLTLNKSNQRIPYTQQHQNELLSLFSAIDAISKNIIALMSMNEQNNFETVHFESNPQSTIIAPVQMQLDWEMSEPRREVLKSLFSYGKMTSTSDLHNCFGQEREKQKLSLFAYSNHRSTNVCQEDLREIRSDESVAVGKGKGPTACQKIKFNKESHDI